MLTSNVGASARIQRPLLEGRLYKKLTLQVVRDAETHCHCPGPARESSEIVHRDSKAFIGEAMAEMFTFLVDCLQTRSGILVLTSIALVALFVYRYVYVIVITQEMVQRELCCPRVGCCHEGAARVTTSARGQLTHVAPFLG